MLNLIEFREKLGAYITKPIVRNLSKSGVKPNTLTFTGLVIDIGAAYAIVVNHLSLGGVLILVAGLFDLLDGALARFTGQATKLGAILDSTVDRVSEAAILCSILAWYLLEGIGATLGVVAIEVVVILAALVGSFLVSYIRARAEGLDLECRVGLFTRAERVIVLAAGLLINQVSIALWILVVFVYITVIQRLFYLRKQMKVRIGGN